MDWMLFIRIVITVVFFGLPVIAIVVSTLFWKVAIKDLRKIRTLIETATATATKPEDKASR